MTSLTTLLSDAAVCNFLSIVTTVVVHNPRVLLVEQTFRVAVTCGKSRFLDVLEVVDRREGAAPAPAPGADQAAQQLKLLEPERSGGPALAGSDVENGNQRGILIDIGETDVYFPLSIPPFSSKNGCFIKDGTSWHALCFFMSRTPTLGNLIREG